MFAPYKNIPKVSIFGSARTRPDDPLYEQTERVARQLAEAGWMVVTGAGPGIMEAGMRGAGVERSIGVSIRLPFETGANSIIADDDKHVAMKYFFTRKLMLVKESAAFVCLPGGFGTLDETFELLTLTQTGKGIPVPIVFLDTPGDPYWEHVDAFVTEQLVPRGLVSPKDTALYRVTDSCDVAVDEITSFYSNYHSIRSVGDDLIIRAPSGAERRAARRAQPGLCPPREVRPDPPDGPLRRRETSKRRARPRSNRDGVRQARFRGVAWADRRAQRARIDRPSFERRHSHTVPPLGPVNRHPPGDRGSPPPSRPNDAPSPAPDRSRAGW